MEYFRLKKISGGHLVELCHSQWGQLGLVCLGPCTDEFHIFKVGDFSLSVSIV